MNKIIRPLSILFLIIGILIGYFWYGTEPHETIGGVFAGLGFSAFLISYAVKAKEEEMEKEAEANS